MKNSCSIIIVILSSITFGYAQNGNLEYQYGFKLYNLTTLNLIDKKEQISFPNTTYKTTESRLTLVDPSVGFQWKSKRSNFHEVELITLRWDRDNITSEPIRDSLIFGAPTLGQRVVSTSIAARHEFIYCFNKLRNTKFVPSVGISGSPYYTRRSTDPKTSNMFNTSLSTLGIAAYIAPRLTYYVSSKIFVDFNIPICIVDTHIDFNYVDNPALSESNKRSNSTTHRFFPMNFSARLGVGIKI